MTEGRRIVAFYEGSGRDDRGRSLEDVLAFDDARLESVHDFIQWLFPLRERSGANPSAPMLDTDAVTAFRESAVLRAALRRSYERMRTFYKSSDRWLTPGDHNHLRITRMLISLRTLGLPDEALTFYGFVTDAAAAKPGSVTETTLRYWREAMQ